ncbi:hypothetical protein, conserved, partial [Plasmodium malariae]
MRISRHRETKPNGYKHTHRNMKDARDSIRTNSRTLENARDSFNTNVTEKMAEERQMDNNCMDIYKEQVNEERKENKENEQNVDVYDKNDERINTTNERRLNYNNSFMHDNKEIYGVNEINNDRYSGNKKKLQIVENQKENFNCSGPYNHFYEHNAKEETKGERKMRKKYKCNTYMSTEKYQEYLEKINQQINDILNRVYKAYKGSNKKQYFSRIFQMRDINCIFSFMFLSLLIIFAIMSEYMGLLLSLLLFIISIQLKYSRTNMALLNSITGILFISIATVFSYSNINKESVIETTTKQNAINNINTNKNLLNNADDKNKDVYFKYDKYVLSLDDNNKILNVEKKRSKEINIDIDKYIYNEYHLFKHLLLNTALDFKNSSNVHKRKELLNGGKNDMKLVYLNGSRKKNNFKPVQRGGSMPKEGNKGSKDFVLNISDTSSDCFS